MLRFLTDIAPGPISPTPGTTEDTATSWVAYAVGAALVVAVIVVVILLLRRRARV